MITESNYADVERSKKGVLDVDTEQYYFDTLRPYIQEMMRTCKTDQELYRTLDKVVNATDSLCARKEFKRIPEEFEVLNIAITDKNYFNGVMKKAPESEKEMVRTLISKISDFMMIIKCEPEQASKEEKIKERIDYKLSPDGSPNGENGAYYTHNMKELNKPNPKTRIPNV